MQIKVHADQSLKCPVHLSQQYFGRLGVSAARDGFLQPRFGPAGAARLEQRVSYGAALQDLKNMMASAGFSGHHFTEHSGRRGGTTAAVAAGTLVFALAKHGRWSSLSTVQKYVNEAGASSREVATALAAPKQPKASVASTASSSSTTTAARATTAAAETIPSGPPSLPSVSFHKVERSTSATAATTLSAATAEAASTSSRDNLLKNGWIEDRSYSGLTVFHFPE